MNSNYQSWGRYPKSTPEKIIRPQWLNDLNSSLLSSSTKNLVFGQGRSYGDSCLNSNGTIISTNSLNRFISFDQEQGILDCEAGVTLEQILDTFLPDPQNSGWFLPVSPGTKYVSIGGAIANDIHGKNHHIAGTFGCHVLSFELLRSDGTLLICSPTQNAELFNATIGGLGLTGIILSAKIKLRKVANAFIEMQSIKFENISEFFKISSESDKDFEYTVAWIDCLAKGQNLGRGIFMRGNHSQTAIAHKKKVKLAVPLDFPNFALNNLSIKLFNFLYYNKQQQKQISKIQHYDPFFYPLDSINNWNRIYGKRGFFQFQCVVPSQSAITNILEEIAKSGRGSFLAVLKQFGTIKSPGLLSFPRAGYTLALDFPNQGQATFELLKKLESIVTCDNGAIYPAKDALMSAQSFKQYFPNLEKFKAHIDPKFESDFWRRVYA